MIHCARLVPVESTDPLMVVSQTREPLPLELPVWTGSADLTPTQRIASMHKLHDGPIYAHQLTPLVPSSIRATPLPPQVWDPAVSLDGRRKLWQQHLAADHYAPWTGGDQSVVERLEPEAVADGLGIFGVRCNPLKSMLHVMGAIRESKMLMHYIAIVSLQFYVIKRGAFLRVRTDAQAPGFSDALPPYLVLHFRDDEARMPSKKKCSESEIPIMATAADAAAMARKWEFPMFLLQVFRWLHSRYPDEFDEDETGVFCSSKIAKNTLQSMMCMRFRHVIPAGFEEALRASNGKWDPSKEAIATNKCFSAPKLGKMLILKPRAPGVSEYVPFVFCHHMFQPHVPILSETAAEEASIVGPHSEANPNVWVDAERKLLWKVMCFMPLQEYEVMGHKRCMKRWSKAVKGIGRLFPKDHRDKLMQYDWYLPFQRPHYLTYVVNKKQLYVYVPRMHWPANMTDEERHIVPMPDDADLRWMSDEAFEWCALRGRVCESLREAVAVAIALGRVQRHSPGYEIAPGLWGPESIGWSPWTSWLVRKELEKPVDAPRDAFVYMKAIQLLTGREEDGIATVVRGPGRATYEELRARSRDAIINGTRDAHRIIVKDKSDPEFAKALQAGLVDWDRCSVFPFPKHLQRTVMRDRLWDMYFPPSRVLVDGGVPWIERFGRPSPCAAIRSTMERLYRELQTDEIRDEIAVCEAMGSSGYDDLPKMYRQAWTMVLMLLQQKEPEGEQKPVAAAATSPASSVASSSSSSGSKRARTEE